MYILFKVPNSKPEEWEDLEKVSGQLFEYDYPYKMKVEEKKEKEKEKEEWS